MAKNTFDILRKLVEEVRCKPGWHPTQQKLKWEAPDNAMLTCDSERNGGKADA